jgi:hypothetical protein
MKISRCQYLSAATVVAMLATVTITTSCDGPPQNPQLANGWVTNCTGPAFGRFSGNGSTGPGPERPVFKINDQLVLAVPKNNWPSAGNFERDPPKCTQFSDLPTAPYLYFVIRGNWSAGYKPGDIPIVSGNRQFQPDIITVRIQREIINPLSAKINRKLKNCYWNGLRRIQPVRVRLAA